MEIKKIIVTHQQFEKINLVYTESKARLPSLTVQKQDKRLFKEMISKLGFAFLRKQNKFVHIRRSET